MSRRIAEPTVARGMPRGWIRLAALALGCVAIAGCTALQQVAALRLVQFDYDRISDVRLAGVAVAGKDSYSDLRPEEIARLALAVAARDVPLDLVVHLRAENPTSNGITARLYALDWTMFLDDRRMVTGDLPQPYSFEPGRPVDVPLPMRFDAVDLIEGGAADLFDLALALAGMRESRREIRLDLLPTVDTAIGPIRYSSPITVRRTIGSAP